MFILQKKKKNTVCVPLFVTFNHAPRHESNLYEEIRPTLFSQVRTNVQKLNSIMRLVAYSLHANLLLIGNVSTVISLTHRSTY